MCIRDSSSITRTYIDISSINNVRKNSANKIIRTMSFMHGARSSVGIGILNVSPHFFSQRVKLYTEAALISG